MARKAEETGDMLDVRGMVVDTAAKMPAKRAARFYAALMEVVARSKTPAPTPIAPRSEEPCPDPQRKPPASSVPTPSNDLEASSGESSPLTTKATEMLQRLEQKRTRSNSSES